MKPGTRQPSSPTTVIARSLARCGPDALRGLVRCSACGLKMQGTWNHDRAHYRCRLPSEYALANLIDHPAAVYLREDALLEPLDEWLATAFDQNRTGNLGSRRPIGTQSGRCWWMSHHGFPWTSWMCPRGDLNPHAR